MTAPLPPLNGLRAFEVAARHLSFRLAAEELHVTPAAISQQVRALEKQLDIALFHRRVRALELTAAGRAALPHLSDGLASFQAGVDALRAACQRDVLAVSVAPSIGARWLVPRLDRLRDAHPEFDIHIDARNDLATFANDGIDAAIRYGRGDYAPHLADCLFSASTFPVCNPALIANGTPLRSAADLAKVTLLHSTWAEETVGAPSWRMWLNAAGASEVDASTGPRFGSDSMLVEAALAGQGVALVSEAPVARELADGRLVRPFPPAVFEQTAFCYWFVYPARHRETPKVLGFRDWLLGEIAREQESEVVTTAT